VLDAIVTAGGRLSPADARMFGTDVKALVRIDGRPLIATVVEALRKTPGIAGVRVVGPRAARSYAEGVDEWIDERATGEENLLAALRAAQTDRIVLSASDLPFVTPAGYADLIERVAPDLDAGYPVYRREEFLAAYPGGRSTFARLADGSWTGGSAFVLNRAPFLRDERILARGFGARKSLFALASLLGPVLLLKFVMGTLRVGDVERRASAILGARVKAVRGADPALAMDCDELGDFAYARAEAAAT
jgi:molybdopterin-guanine dinucleotide biosynthesis protein A